MNTFLKAQVNSVVSTGLDFGVTVFLTELCGLWSVASSAVGRVVGGACNFLLGRHWVYDASNSQSMYQIMKFVIVWWINFAFNIGGMYLMTDLCKINYVISKIVVAVIFGVFVNYAMQKRYVFKAKI